MTLYEIFDINPNVPELISLVGAGGKTTTLFRLAQELKALGKKVLVTTTTHMALPEASQADRLIVDHSKNPFLLSGNGRGMIVCLGERLVNEKGKLKGVDPEYVSEIYQKQAFNHILVEADGSRRRPIKAPAHYEPVIPRGTTRTIGVIGLDALGQPITAEHVHRPELFCSVTGKEMGDLIDRQCLVSLILAENGLFRNAPHECTRHVVLNKADRADRREQAEMTVHELIELKVLVDGFVIAAIGKGYIYAPGWAVKRDKLGFAPLKLPSGEAERELDLNLSMEYPG